MSGIIYFVMVLLLLTVIILFFMYGQNNETSDTDNEKAAPTEAATLNKDEGENHFAGLMSTITPPWYWRINHEYIAKKMKDILESDKPNATLIKYALETSIELLKTAPSTSTIHSTDKSLVSEIRSELSSSMVN